MGQSINIVIIGIAIAIIVILLIIKKKPKVLVSSNLMGVMYNVFKSNLTEEELYNFNKPRFKIFKEIIKDNWKLKCNYKYDYFLTVNIKLINSLDNKELYWYERNIHGEYHHGGRITEKEFRRILKEFIKND